ncbi:FkbM family methyltransferase [Aestuariivita boseongensis]|uniref:FkbM family methyltransferase n=1 Tax=Aestuariivita boseongensis TaxID=1470562 RepID=UPI00155DB7EB|nr:FkbM family methyltransferase [Aestuariivita boseongensis]
MSDADHSFCEAATRGKPMTHQDAKASYTQDIAEIPHAIFSNEYGFYCVPNEYHERKIATLLKNGDVYEPHTLRFLRRQVGQGDIVTGGAFIGDFFPALCEVLAPKAKLHSFEPVPISFAAALETVRLNGLSSVALHPVAVGAEDGTAAIQIARRSGKKIAAGERIVDTMIADGKIAIEVKVKTIDSLVPKSRKVSLLHLDVEGFEQSALEGSARILNDNKPLVVLESGKPWKNRTFAQKLNSLVPDAGYRFMGEIEKNGIFAPG